MGVIGKQRDPALTVKSQNHRSQPEPRTQNSTDELSGHPRNQGKAQPVTARPTPQNRPVCGQRSGAQAKRRCCRWIARERGAGRHGGPWRRCNQPERAVIWVAVS
jgi:hypothetical protein